MAEDDLEPLITECPSCTTRFRVTEAQLQVASGRVRCGACLAVFQGVDHIVFDSSENFTSREEARDALDELLDELNEGDADAATSGRGAETPDATDAQHPVDEAALTAAGPVESEDAWENAPERIYAGHEEDAAQREMAPASEDEMAPASEDEVAPASEDEMAPASEDEMAPDTERGEDQEAALPVLPVDRTDVDHHDPQTRVAGEPHFGGASTEAAEGAPAHTGVSAEASVYAMDQNIDEIAELVAAEALAGPDRADEHADEHEEERAEESEAEDADESEAEYAPEDERAAVRTGEQPDEPIEESAQERAEQGDTGSDVAAESGLALEETGNDLWNEDEPQLEDSADELRLEPGGERADLESPQEPIAAEAAPSPHGVATDPVPEVSFARERRRWWLPIFLLAALAVLAVQIFWYQFERWGRDPAIRPVYGFACSLIGCELPVMRDLDLLKASQLVVRSHPDMADALVVDAMIVNEAEFPQPFPALELRFTTIDGTLVAGRRFQPAEYLAGELSGAVEMAPMTPIRIALEIEDPGGDAVNYFLTFR